MKVLVTGGTGLVGTAAVRALLAAGHQVRLFSRNAAADAARWGEGVEAREAARGTCSPRPSARASPASSTARATR